MTVGLVSLGIAPFWQPGQRPFAASSPGNTPIAANPILMPMVWPAYNGSNYFAALKIPIDYQPVPSAPSCVVTLVGPSWQYPAGPRPARLFTVGFNGATGDSDQEACSVIGNDCASYWILQRPSPSATTATCSAVAYANLATDSGFGTPPVGSQIAAGIYGTGQSCMMGLMIKEEFTNNAFIDHIIDVCMHFQYVNGFHNNAVLPAIANDGPSNNGGIVEGLRMAIPAGTAMPAGLSPYGQKMFNTMLIGSGHSYGAFACDFGPAFKIYLGANINSPSTGWTNDDIYGVPSLGPNPSIFNDTKILLQILQKVGYPLDGMLVQIHPYQSCDIQCQQLATVGTNLMQIKRTSDSTLLNIGMGAAPQSLLDTASIATFCSGTTGRLATYYGQFTAHANFTSVGSAGPVIYTSGALITTANGRPALSFDGTGANIMQAVGSSTTYPAGTVYLLAKGVQLVDYAANYTLISGDTAGCLELRVDITTGLVRLLAQGGTTIGLSPYPIPLNTPVNIGAFYNTDGSYSISLNAVRSIQGTGTLVPVVAANIQVGAGPSGANPFKGLITGWMISTNAGLNVWPIPQWMMENYQNQLLGPVGPIVTPATAFDPAHKSAGIVLSFGQNDAIGPQANVPLNLTANYQSGGSNVNVFGTLSKTTGLFYHELAINVIAAHEFMGFANNSFLTSVSQALGNDAAHNSVGWWSSGEVKVAGVTLTTIATYAVGSILGMCLDLTHQKVWFGIVGATSVLWNNDILANQNPATNTGGISISTVAGALFPVCGLQSFGDQVTANFGAYAYRNATLLPAGFGNWV